jgi:glycine oxidase
LEETAIDAELVGPGMLRIAMTDDEAYDIGQEWEWQESLGLHADCLSAKEARLLEPSLAPDVRLAIRSPEERNVEPKRLVRALALACTRRGVRIIEGEPIVDFEREGSSVTAAMSPGQHFSCGALVVAGGAWSENLGRRLDFTLPVYPVRGQILALSCLPPPMRHTIYSHSGYLVPKSDGRVIVGATEDEAGFDVRPTVDGIGRLLAMAPSLVPSLRSAAFELAWAGLRPASADGLPILGRLPGWNNSYCACGHFRNGILLAPITGEVLTHEILDGTAHPLTAAFRPDRFESLVHREDLA